MYEVWHSFTVLAVGYEIIILNMLTPVVLTAADFHAKYENLHVLYTSKRNSEHERLTQTKNKKWLIEHNKTNEKDNVLFSFCSI